MAQVLTSDDVRTKVRKLIREAGNLSSFCYVHDIPKSDMSKFLSGQRCSPNRKVLDMLGLRREITFVEETTNG